MPKESKEFEEKSKIINLRHKRDLQKHEFKMKEFIYLRESENIHHEHEKERGRIKSAEIRKMQERKEFSQMRRDEYRQDRPK